MKTSLIATVLNEEKTIVGFLKSIYAQTKLPDEIIIVDAGSTDKTIEKIAEFAIPERKKAPNIKLIFKKGNRSEDRNEAIKRASGEIILVSDAGCILDKAWVRNISEAFTKENIDVAAGFYKPICKNTFQKCLSVYTSVMPDKLNKDKFLPSSRSIAFKKKAWGKVGGYPEELTTCEDLVFAKKLKKMGYRFKVIKDAVVYWPQRKNFKEAFKQFFNYARGDGQAHYVRVQTPFLFARYLVGFVLLILFLLWNSFSSLIILVSLFITYLFWAIVKNYRYINKKNAFYFLPLLQLLSDIAVILGMTYGFIESLKMFTKKNIGLTSVIIIYSITMLSVIKWGLPNSNHPFTYHMDEWHQMQSVRSIFEHGTNNIAGAANGPMFQFILSGILLVPLYFLKIINPFVITSIATNLDIQEKLFIILRLNTLVFGVLSIVVLWKIIKRFFSMNPVVPVLFFVFSPIWLALSNYFKYDIALIFWIICSIYFLLKLIDKPSFKTFIIASVISSLALSTKISAFPIVIVLLLSYIVVVKKIKKRNKMITIGFLVFIAVFVLLGIPDIVFLHKGNYYEYFYSNLIQNPNLSNNFKLGFPWFLYLISVQYPIAFGLGFYILFLISFVFQTVKFIAYKIKKQKVDKLVLFLMASFIIFLISLISIKIEGRGNRLLVLSPFMILIVACSIKNFLRFNKKITYLFLTVFLAMQVYQATGVVLVKHSLDTRNISSEWIKKNINKGSVIGLESVPIYQRIPDFVLSDYYKKNNNYFNYEIMSVKNQLLPGNIIITDSSFYLSKLPTSDKSKLILRLIKEGYIKEVVFHQDFSIANKIFTYDDIYFSNLIPISEISFFKKNSSQ